MTVRALGLFTAMLACSGQPAPTSTSVQPPPPAREIAVTPAAEIPAVVGAPCDPAHPCGGKLECGGGPGGYCTKSCSERCGDDPCVESPTLRSCRAACKSNADCREGYACDPLWNACTVPNAEAIVAKDCGAPPGFGRDPAFAPATALAVTEAGARQHEPTAVILDDGTAVVMHARTVGLAASRIDPRGETAGTHPFSQRATHPRLARSASGRLFAIARDPRISLATSTDRGVSWSTPIDVQDLRDCPAGECTKPMVIVGPDPQRKGSEIVYVAYAAGGGLRVRASADGGATFNAARTALAGTYGNLAVGVDGALYAIAVRGGPGVYGAGDNRIDFTFSADGGKSFARPQMVNVNGERLPVYFTNPSVVVDSARKWIYLAYVRGGRDGRWDIALLATNDKGKTWKRTRIGDDPPCAIHMVPNLALDPTTGQLHVAWYDSRGLRFAHAVCTYGLGLCRQLGRINDQPFVAMSTMRAGDLALGDYQTLVVDNVRRTLHAIWTQPVVEQNQTVGRIFHAKAKLPLR